MIHTKIAFIGTGKMATALISSICKNNLAKEIIASDHQEKNLKKMNKKIFNQKLKIFSTTDNKEAVRNSDIVFICVKPQDIDAVLNEIKDEVNNQLIVSIAAGIKITHIESILNTARIIRVMPNINCLVGEMAAGFSAGKYATKDDIENVSQILKAAGMSFFVEEKLIDSLSVVSGAGPAFFAYFIKSIAEAGIKKGLKKEMAYELAAKTASGTGKLLLELKLSPDELIGMVASKKGVTVEALKILNKEKANKTLEQMFNAAYKRSKELGK